MVLMAKRNLNYYLIKVTRITGWILLPLMLLYISTGFALCGKFGFNRMIGTQGALAIHQLFDLPLVFLFVVHAVVSVYLAFRRWGWLRR